VYCWRPELGTHELAGRPMPPPSGLARVLGVPIWNGCRRLGPGEVVGYGQGPSYDSRHIGPVREADLWGVYRPIRVVPPPAPGALVAPGELAERVPDDLLMAESGLGLRAVEHARDLAGDRERAAPPLGRAGLPDVAGLTGKEPGDEPPQRLFDER
jgi:hypothetical protein